MKKRILKTWYVYHLNCDCQSDTVAYGYKPRWKVAPDASVVDQL